MGIDHFKHLYAYNGEFVDINKVCVEYKNHFHSIYVEYTLQSDILLKGINCVFLEALLERV